MARWVKVLKTPNVRGEIVMDENLRVFVNGGRFTETSYQSGSTRTRLVLAHHAAVLETSLANEGNHPGLVIFDAPRQHELSRDDLSAYLSELRRLATKYAGRVQIVLSIAEMLLAPGEDDEIWGPKFGDEKEPRYLGPLNPSA